MVLAIGAAIIAGYNLLDPINAANSACGHWRGYSCMTAGRSFVGEQPIGLMAYPVLPWIGVIAFGYGLGGCSPRRLRNAIVRSFARAGDVGPVRRAALDDDLRRSGVRDRARGRVARLAQSEALGAAVMVFMDVQKYPPSLQYVLVTLALCL